MKSRSFLLKAGGSLAAIAASMPLAYGASLIDSWDMVNAQVTLTSANERWNLRLFGQNLMNDDNIVGSYQTDPSSGLFTNAFLIEPRLYGATLGFNF